MTEEKQPGQPGTAIKPIKKRTCYRCGRPIHFGDRNAWSIRISSEGNSNKTHPWQGTVSFMLIINKPRKKVRFCVACQGDMISRGSSTLHDKLTDLKEAAMRGTLPPSVQKFLDAQQPPTESDRQ